MQKIHNTERSQRTQRRILKQEVAEETEISKMLTSEGLKSYNSVASISSCLKLSVFVIFVAFPYCDFSEVNRR